GGGGPGVLRGCRGGNRPPFFTHLHDTVTARHRALWRQHVAKVNAELLDRAPPVYTRLVLHELLGRATITDPKAAALFREWERLRAQPPAAGSRAGHQHGGPAVPAPTVDPHPVLDKLQADQTRQFAGRLMLWPKERSDLAGFGGELDRVMQMPGWTNVWTMPIQNRVDMLATGVNTTVG